MNKDNKQFEKVSDFTKISKERLKRTSSLEVGREVGSVEISDQESPSGRRVVEKNKVKDEILAEAESGESINHFINKTVKKNLGPKEQEGLWGIGII